MSARRLCSLARNAASARRRSVMSMSVASKRAARAWPSGTSAMANWASTASTRAPRRLNSLDTILCEWRQLRNCARNRGRSSGATMKANGRPSRCDFSRPSNAAAARLRSRIVPWVSKVRNPNGAKSWSLAWLASAASSWAYAARSFWFSAASWVKPAGVEQHLAMADFRKIVIDRKVPDHRFLRQHFLQQATEARDVPLPVAQLIDKLAFRFFPAGQELFIEGLVGAGHAQVPLQRQKRVPHHLDHLLQAALELVDVDQREDRAVNRVVLGAIRPDAQGVPMAGSVTHLALPRLKRFDHFQNHPVEVRHVEADLDVTEAAPDIGRDQVEELLRGGSKAPDGQVVLHHDHRDLHAGQQVVQVVVGAVHLEVAVLEFLIDGLQLLVGRLQLFLRGLQFLVGALDLFVGGLDFLVRRFQFLIGRFLFLDDGPERIASGFKLPVQPVALGPLRPLPMAARPRPGLGPGRSLRRLEGLQRFKQDQAKRLLRRRNLERHHLQCELALGPFGPAQ